MGTQTDGNNHNVLNSLGHCDLDFLGQLALLFNGCV